MIEGNFKLIIHSDMNGVFVKNLSGDEKVSIIIEKNKEQLLFKSCTCEEIIKIFNNER